VPDPRGILRGRDARFEEWLHHCELDSVVLDRRTPATEGREQQVVKPAQPRSGGTPKLRGYTSDTAAEQ
jgi:hypothetical protein